MNCRFRVGRVILMWETSEILFFFFFFFGCRRRRFWWEFFSLGFYPAPVFGCTSTEKLVFSVEVIFCRVSRHHDKMWLCEKFISNCMFCLQILEKVLYVLILFTGMWQCKVQLLHRCWWLGLLPYPNCRLHQCLWYTHGDRVCILGEAATTLTTVCICNQLAHHVLHCSFIGFGKAHQYHGESVWQRQWFTNQWHDIYLPSCCYTQFTYFICSFICFSCCCPQQPQQQHGTQGSPCSDTATHA